MDAPPLPPTRPPLLDRLPPWAGLGLVVALFALIVWPVLGRLEFFDGVEHFNLATVQEMRRAEAEGRRADWMLPTLQGEARVVKPPLAAWVTAALVRPADVAAISTPERPARDAAVRRFVELARLPTLACSALLLAGTFVLGWAVTGSARVGAAAAVMCGGTAIFFQQGRRATTDVQLALWVTWANALLAAAVFRGRAVLGFVGGGLALGLASMAKGPHIALLMTLVPLAVHAAVGRWAFGAAVARASSLCPADTGWKPVLRSRRTIFAAVAGIVLALIVGLWWYAYVAARVDGIWDIWYREVTRKDAQVGRNVMAADPWYAYASLLGLLLPWTGWLVVGAGWAVYSALCARRRRADSPAGPPPFAAADARAVLFPLLLVVVPVLVMSGFAEKKERYLLPFAAPAAVVAAAAAVRWWDGRTGRAAALAPPARWAGLAAGASAFVAAAAATGIVVVAGYSGAKNYRTDADQPTVSPEQAAMATAVAGAALAAGLWASRRGLLGPVLAATLVAWVGQEMRLAGKYAASDGDRDDRPQQELADRIWRRWPTAEVYSADPVTLYGQLNRPAVVLSMHLNRPIRTWPPPGPIADLPRVLITDYVKHDPADPGPPVPAGYRREAVVELRTGARYVDVAVPSRREQPAIRATPGAVPPDSSDVERRRSRNGIRGHSPRREGGGSVRS